MSEIWEYNSESNNSIRRIYLTSITSNYYGKKFGWTVVFNDGLKCNLDDEMINKYNLTELDRTALNEAKENSNKFCNEVAFGKDKQFSLSCLNCICAACNF